MYKKILAFLFIGVMVIALAACGESGSAAKQNQIQKARQTVKRSLPMTKTMNQRHPQKGK